MLDNKAIEESTKIIKQLISEQAIVIPETGRKTFFLEKSRISLVIAKRLLRLQREENINANMWIINTSYYAMFFAATALLAHHNHTINTEIGIHKLTYHALVYYFVKERNVLTRKVAENYKDSVEDAEELLQLGERRIKELVTFLDNEQTKRKRYTYDMGEEAEIQKAETSVDRATAFIDDITLALKR